MVPTMCIIIHKTMKCHTQGGVPCGESCKCVDCKNCTDGGAGRDGDNSDVDMTVSKPPRSKSSASKPQRHAHHDMTQAAALQALGLLQEEQELAVAKHGGAGKGSKSHLRRSVLKRRPANDSDEEHDAACAGGWGNDFDPTGVSSFPAVSDCITTAFHGLRVC